MFYVYMIDSLRAVNMVGKMVGKDCFIFEDALRTEPITCVAIYDMWL